MKLIAYSAYSTDSAAENSLNVLRIDNATDPRTLALDGVQRVELHFPKFTDGRAYSQAFLLRRRLKFAGEIWATGDVLVDQLIQMRRSGFDAAVLRADQNLDIAQAQLERLKDFKDFKGFYQGDATTPHPRFAREYA